MPSLVILRCNDQMTLKVKVNDPYFQYQPRESQGACLVQIWLFIAQIHDKLPHGQPHVLEFWVKLAKLVLTVKVNDPHIHFQQEVSHDSCLVQIWWYQLKSVSYRADKVKFTDGQTDGHRQRQYLFGLKGQGGSVSSPMPSDTYMRR